VKLGVAEPAVVEHDRRTVGIVGCRPLQELRHGQWLIGDDRRDAGVIGSMPHPGTGRCDPRLLQRPYPIGFPADLSEAAPSDAA
jgi:hypothetical protein